MFKVQNVKTKKFAKDAITGKVKFFDTHDAAQKWADSSERYSNIGATAFNSTRPSKYTVV